MRISYSVVFFCAFLLSFNTVTAQYLQFTENKGQWDSKVTYAADMGGSAFFLQKQGYKVLLNDTADLTAIQNYYGGHSVKHDGGDPYHAGQINGGGLKNSSSTVPTLPLHMHAYEVTFINANANPQIIPDKIVDGYNNYYHGNDPSKWAAHCMIYQAVLYKNVYPGIDVRFYTNTGTLKYDIIVNPGGDIRKIALRFDGVNGLDIKKGDLIVKTSVGDVRELSPMAYQVDTKGRTSVSVKYVVSGNMLYFQTAGFSTSSTLVIDPTLIFSSFTKSVADNWGYTATYDAQGNAYGGGIVFANGYPTSNGPSVQPNFAGGSSDGTINGHDIGIIKLSKNGTQKLYATYFGGGDNEQPHSMVVDAQGNLIVVGRTKSIDFPVKSPTVGPGGAFDIFIAKFSPDGTALLGSRKIGGTGSDGVNMAPKEVDPGVTPGTNSLRRNYGDDARSEVIVDGANNIYLASCTQSDDTARSKSLATPGAFQQKYGGGDQDGMLIKTDPNLNILFISYLGGQGNDAAFVLALNPSNNDIYVAGGTTSTNLQHVGINAGVLHSSFQGGETDGFVTIISNDGSTQVRTVYVGTAGDDMVYGIQFDKFSFPYIMGTTTQAFPLSGNVNFTSQSNGRQFITKLKQDLSGIEYSTNFGKTGLPAEPDISPTAFLVDACENVYVSGWGGGLNSGEHYPNAGTIGLSVTPNALKNRTDNSDFYFFVLEKNAASQLFGSFYGETGGAVGDHVDGGTSRFDKQGVIYQAICANCGRSPDNTGTGFPTGSVGGLPWAGTNVSTMSAYCNEAIVKIAFELAGVNAHIRTSINGVLYDTSGCISLTVDFTDTIARAKQYVWDFGDGSARVNTTARSVSHTYNNIGTYTVMLIAIDSATCNIADTVYTHIRARDDYAKVAFTSAKLPPCTSLRYMFVNHSVPPNGKPFSAQSFQWDFGDGTTVVSGADTIYHDYSAAGSYHVSLRLNDTNYCNSPDADSIVLRIAANVKAQFNIPPGCAPYTVVVNNTSQAGQQFFWDFGDGSTSTESDPTHLYVSPGTYTVKMVAVDSGTCNLRDSTSGTVSVGPKPIANYTFVPVPSQEDTPTTFFNNSTGGTHYKWDFGDGNTLNTVRADTPVVHQYIATNTYNVCLVAFNDFGCTDTLCGPIQALIRPLIDVPNAFTPNGDGINDQVHVKGFGITKMDWRIYNRWGTMVFQSSSTDIGWDGYYNGVLQPQEVYTYVLTVTFFDGAKGQKKGDITLLR